MPSASWTGTGETREFKGWITADDSKKFTKKKKVISDIILLPRWKIEEKPPDEAKYDGTGESI